MNTGKFQTGRSRHKEKVIAALLSTTTLKDAASESGVGVSTIKKWLTLPAFQAEMTAAKTAILANTTNRLINSSLAAVDVLVQIAQNPLSNESSRVAASSKLVDMAYKAGLVDSLEARLAQLEQGDAE